MKKLFLILFIICAIDFFGQCPYTISASYTPATCSSCCDGIITSTVAGSGSCAPSTFYLQPWGTMSFNGTFSNVCPGSYTVEFSTACCIVSCSINVTYSSTNILENENSLIQIKAYPNPVSNTLYISSEQYFEAGTQIEIVNYLGQTVLKVFYKNEIDVSQLSSGCYLIKITTPDKHQFHSKFIKE